jgi:hypothetical protein
MQPAGGGVGDIHARPPADVLQVAEVFKVFGLVVGVALGLMETIPVEIRRYGRGNLLFGVV